MAVKNTCTPEIMERVVKLAQHFSKEEVAEIVGYGYATINRICSLDKAGKSGDLEYFKNSRYPIVMKEYFMEKYSLSFDSEPKEEEPKDNTAVAIVSILTRLDKLTEILTETNKLLNAVGSRVGNLAAAEAERAKQVLDSLNANTDIVCGYIKEHKDILNGIKVNTRPRGKEE